MGELQVTIDPKEVGLSTERLARIDDHFRHYVDDGRLPGYTVAIARYGQIAYLATYGMRDVENAKPTTLDTIYRIYSMTKPITSLALMMLVEEGKLQITDPVANYIPSFADMRVFTGGSALKPITAPSREPMRVWHLLTHTSGMTYGFNYFDAVDDIYRRSGFEFGIGSWPSLEEACDNFAKLPLCFEPGTSWNYSVSTDIVGRIVEVVSGMTLDDFFATRILGPLGMRDTSFHVPEDKADRLAALYQYDAATGGKTLVEPAAKMALRQPRALSGGGGLYSTSYDYWRFLQMLENGGELDGVRIVSPTTIDMMTMNHLPGNSDITTFGRTLGEEVFYDGLGFGLGFSVVVDQARTRVACPEGTFGWGGMASTAFWVDPVEEITATFYTQLLPSTTHPIRPYLRSLVYQSIIE
jgi:CubicO group peptidase (beta-lactamase class C family)